MTKERKSFSLDEINANYLDRPSINASGLVNELLTAHRESSSGEDALIEWQIREIEREIEDVDRQLASLEEKRDSLQDRLSNLKEEREQRSRRVEATIDEVAAKLEGVDRDPENPAIQRWADELDITPKELITELPDEDEDDFL